MDETTDFGRIRERVGLRLLGELQSFHSNLQSRIASTTPFAMTFLDLPVGIRFKFQSR
jgi:hypothetical protein